MTRTREAVSFESACSAVGAAIFENRYQLTQWEQNGEEGEERTRRIKELNEECQCLTAAAAELRGQDEADEVYELACRDAARRVLGD